MTERRAVEKLVPEVRLAKPAPQGGKLGLGLVGLGGFCMSTHLPNLATLRDRYQVVATCNRRAAMAQDIARQYGAAQACSDVGELLGNPAVQLVMIATQHDLARAAGQRGAAGGEARVCGKAGGDQRGAVAGVV